MKKNLGILSILILTLVMFAGCYTPNPLYGTWSDNDGNKIQFMDGGSFNATIKDSSDTPVTYEGDWATIDNVLVFTIKGETSTYTRTTQWDIIGAIMHLTWTSNNSTRNLTLYHTSRS